jgi:dipeptidyl aminopeptidase/acylaminoacyl peptidase
MYRLVALTIALVLLAPSARAVEPPFTLEQVLSSAFPSELVAAPAGGRVAWVLNARGARNVWVAEPPEYRGRQVTAFAGDEGLGIAQLAWTPDAKAVVFTRGGDLDSFAAVPNAANAAELPKQAVWVATLGEEPRQLVEGHTPAVSPRGDGVAYVSGSEIWWARFDGAPRPVRIVQTKGGVHTLRWSPDGSRLAFVVGRGTHGYVGVYTLATKGLVFLDPSVDRDAEPAWSPDGSRIAFMRFPTGGVDFVFVPRREGHPWSIRVADATTGEGREVWRADAGRGSVFRNVVADSQLVWSADDRLVFPWEKDGWTHLYSIPSAGGAALLLTPGAFEVEHVSVGPGRRDLLFSSNQGDAERRHVWRVAAAGGAPVAVTSGTGIEWAPAATSDGRAVAYLASDARRPARAVVKVGSEAPRELAPEAIPAGFPAAALVEPQPVVYAAADGAPIRAQLFATPTRAGEPRRPAVVFVHGGSRRQMLLGWHYSDYYHKAYALNQYLASRGYVVLAINFRSGIGYGM